jgi:Mg2+ and Co2+ transporter CorA
MVKCNPFVHTIEYLIEAHQVTLCSIEYNMKIIAGENILSQAQRLTWNNLTWIDILFSLAISSIILPFLLVSSISSIYGMNINLPGGIERGSLASFGILIGVMLILSGGMLYFFHRRHWI